MIKAETLIKNLNHWIPFESAESWDNVGHLIEGKSKEITHALVCGDLTEAVIDQAFRQKAQLIVTHHPVIFPFGKGPSKIKGKKLLHGLHVIAAHTNFDRCALEPMLELAEDLGCKNPHSRLGFDSSDLFLKLVVFIPETHLEVVSQALFKAGAGIIGQYDLCSFQTQGTGTYRPLQGSRPWKGSVKHQLGEMQRIAEIKFETIIPRSLKQTILQVMREVHPYEEVAYDLYSVEQSGLSSCFAKGIGYGFVATLEKQMPLLKLFEKVKAVFEVDHLMVNLSKQECGQKLRKKHPVSRVAFSPGNGKAFIQSALRQGCDVFITGEVGYHEAREAAEKGLVVIELGHHQSEWYYLKAMSDWLQKQGVKTKIIRQEFQSML
jgi:dinuclear metal center YbgI/SA1388 family protein